jgi:DNA-binding transcriptional MerR regulator
MMSRRPGLSCSGLAVFYVFWKFPHISLDIPVTGRFRIAVMRLYMKINELANLTGVSPKTIRYYESIGVLPEPHRSANGYREYEDVDMERLKLVAGARRLEFSLDDVTEIIAMRDRREAPCRMVLDKLEQKADEIAQRIAELQQLEQELRRLHSLGQTFPTDDVDGKACVCHLVSEQSDTN